VIFALQQARRLYEQTIAALCQARGIDRDALRLPGLMFDIDTPKNAAELLVRPWTARWLLFFEPHAYRNNGAFDPARGAQWR
jgi:hypothetical protein